MKKLNKRYKFSICMLLATVAVTGCKKGLDLIAKDTLTEVSFWKTPADFKLAANAFYSMLPGFGYEDMEADIAFSTPNTLSNGQLQKTDESDVWNNAYVQIRSANVAIEKASSTTDEAIKRYMAEVKFFRAYNYWKLVHIFGGVPLIDKVYQPLDPGLFVSRSSQQETVEFILKDLDEAIPNLPLKSQLPAEDIGRITKGTALALKARVSLFEGTWEKFRNQASASKYLDQAIVASNEIMSSNEYALYTGSGEQSYRYLFIEQGDDSPESILDHRYQRNISGHSAPYLYDRVGYLPTKALADLYLDNTGLPISKSGVFQGYGTFTSEFAHRDPRMTMTMIVPGTETVRVFHPSIPVANWPDFPQRNLNTGYILYKYMSEDAFANNSGEGGAYGGAHDFDRHIIRYAEVLLIYAEAVYEKNGTITDADLDLSVNLLRDRAGMPHLTNAFVMTNNLNMREEIRRERTVELALEGFRRDDLTRWKTAETVLPEDVKGIKIKGSEWENRPPYNVAGYQSRVDGNGFLIVESSRTFDPGKNYLQPIPTKEIAFYTQSGFTLEQNPGW